MWDTPTWEPLQTVGAQQAPEKLPSQLPQEISALAGCRSQHITRYYGAVMRPGSSELLIIMELLACSVADLVSERERAGTGSTAPQRTAS